ncbi:16S rRNA (guanine(966)-N(2))-methyltransferase RsmD [Roseburia sp. BX1005]|uniref:16S rRNA (Guanine(966)-N(2))-methyltransferase RsmD n=1 Tax=Roseburia zhanii TaxID=2763064 RepID=A0A923LMM4_9FIRM|nr:16S rRNA (guanine(966)-N(2))-methyltransferase RsmD [Roseburia zhanii]MBC5713690.1 16S rRNA (guanine(966)-N(2))-methyltransferase RsmD [Roseburia zhanii]
MRIIAGSKRRLPLKTVEGKDTRPTTDRIKETLFNMLQNEIYGCYFLDLFAGSGQIGLEALSRGARYVVFVENAKKAAACITENIRFTKSDKESLLLQMDVIAALRSMEGKYQFDIIFMDPPYDKELEREVLEYLKSSSLLKEDTLMITEASLQTDLSYVNELGFTILKEKCYKTNKHIFIQKQ